MHIDCLKRVPLRELWAHEARDFTTWPSENLDLLGETLGIPQLYMVRCEAAAGVFSADILADADPHCVTGSARASDRARATVRSVLSGCVHAAGVL